MTAVTALATKYPSGAQHKAEHAALAESLVAWEQADPERARMISVVLRYRAAWRELAESLEDCDRRELWKRWGFESFDAYCTEELRLSKSTLTRYRNALAFLRDFDVPPAAGVQLQSVEVARQALAAGESGEIPAEQAGDLVTRALEGSEGPRQLADELQQAKRGFEPRLFGGTPSGPDPVALAKARKACARLEAATRPLREQLPQHVLNALQVVTAYLSAPEAQEVGGGPATDPRTPPSPDADDLASAPQGPIPYTLAPEADLPADPPLHEDAQDPAVEPTFETSAACSLASALHEDPPAAGPLPGETTYEREDAGTQAVTPQGQDLLRRCNELTWLMSRAEADDLASVRADLSSRIGQLSNDDRKALKAAMGSDWEAMSRALADSAAKEPVTESEIVYDE